MKYATLGSSGGPTHPWFLNGDKAQPFYKRAIELGINFFDTVDYYSHGDSEENIARAIRKYIRREDAVIATKLEITL